MTPDEWDRRQADGTHDAAARIVDGTDMTPPPLEVLSEADVIALPPPEWLVDGLIMAGTLAIMYGPPGAGKTHLALSLAKSVASGIDFLGHAIRKPGSVLYVVAENVAGIGPRLSAWNSHHRPDSPRPVSFIRQAVQVTGYDSAARLADAASGTELIVIDTLARCTLGVEENSAREMGEVVAVLDWLRDSTGAAVMPVHHSGKDGARGARGSNALLGAADTELQVLDGRLSVTKQRSAAEEHPTPWKLHPVAGSVVPVYRSSSELVDDRSRRRDVLDALVAVCPVRDAVSSGVWSDSVLALGLSRSTFHAHKKVLLDSGEVVQEGRGNAARFRPGAPSESESNPPKEGGLVGLDLHGMSKSESDTPESNLDPRTLQGVQR